MPTNTKQQILFITSFPQRECGIATYSKDLLSYLKSQFSTTFSYSVCALEDGENNYSYNNDVKYRWNIKDKLASQELASKINSDNNIKLIFIQHEFGLFGGEWGEDLIKFLKTVSKPVVTTFHTVLPKPTEHLKSLVEEIYELSQVITVMTQKSLDILDKEYSLCNNKISVIPHGTHSTLKEGKNTLKEKYDFKDSLILSTFGLISANKSIETALDALPKIVQRFPTVKYLVLGKTHPGVVQMEGEKYRKSLEEKCKDLGITKNVLFINKYLTLNELLDYLNLTDIYLFTSKDPHQAVSGTFSYARSCGCPLVATNIPHAAELLADGSGVLIDFESPNQLSEAVIDLLSNPQKRSEMGKKGFENSLESSWENVSIKYARLFRRTLHMKDKQYFSLPNLNYNHLEKMQTNMGLLRFAEISTPIETSGYSLKDNSLAAIAYVYQNKLFVNSTFPESYFQKSVNFLEYCQFSDGSLANYLEKNKLKLKISYKENYLKANATALWALGELISCDFLDDSLKNRCLAAAKKLTNWIKEQEVNAGSAIYIKGLAKIYDTNKDSKLKSLITSLSTKLIKSIYSNDFYTKKEYQVYDEIGVSEALIYSYYVTENLDFKIKAKEIFKNWANNLFYVNNALSTNDSDLQYSKDNLIYPEDPMHLFQLISVLNTFYHAFEEDSYKNKMDVAFNWFLGENYLKRMMYNPSSGGCYSKMTKAGIDINQNTSPTLAFILSRLFIEKASKTQKNLKHKQKNFTEEIG